LRQKIFYKYVIFDKLVTLNEFGLKDDPDLKAIEVDLAKKKSGQGQDDDDDDFFGSDDDEQETAKNPKP